MAEAQKSKIGLYVIIGMAVIILSIVLYFGFKEGGWFRGAGCDPLRNGFDKNGNPNPKCQFNNPSSTNTPAPTGTSGWTSDNTFPLRKGSWGAKVAGLQKALGFPEGKCSTCADGQFGQYTEDKLKAKTGKTEVATQADYNAIVNPPKPVVESGKNFDDLKKNLGGKYTVTTGFGGGVSTIVSGKNTKFEFIFLKNGRFFVYKSGVDTAVAKGTYEDGGTEMRVDGGDSYGNWISHPVTDNMASIVKDIE